MTQPPTDLVDRLQRIGLVLPPNEAMLTGVLVGLELEHRFPERQFRDRLHREIARIQGITAEQVEARIVPWELNLIPKRHPPCGQWLGRRPHECPTPANALECIKGHLKAIEWTVSPLGFGNCRACDRERWSTRRYMGTHCIKGHLKTLASWRWDGSAWHCATCRVVRQQRLGAERRRQGNRGQPYDDVGTLSISAKSAD